MSRTQFVGQPVARVPSDMLTGFLPAFAAALREGIDVTWLDGVASWHDGLDTHHTQSKADRRTVLEHDRGLERLRLANARRQAKRATTDSSSDYWADQAADADQRLSRITHDLAHLDEPAKPTDLGSTFEVDVRALLEAAAAMAEAPRRYPRDLVRKSHLVLTDRRITVLPDTSLEASTSVRLPARGGVVSLGPISWTLPNQPALNTGLMWAALEAQGHPAPWLSPRRPPAPSTLPVGANRESGPTRRGGPAHRARVRLSQLHEDLNCLGLRASMIDRLLGCPFVEAPYVVRAVAAGEPLPEWVGPEWGDPRWARWLHHVYTAPEFSQPGTEWGEPSWHRQMALDLTIGNGGTSTFANILAAYERQGLSRFELKRITRTEPVRSATNVQAPGWAFPLNRSGQWPRRGMKVNDNDYGFTTISCPTCRETADTAVRALELPGDLLCPNRHLPLANHPLAKDLRVPAEYLWLRVPRSIWSARRGRSPINRDPLDAL